MPVPIFENMALRLFSDKVCIAVSTRARASMPFISAEITSMYPFFRASSSIRRPFLLQISIKVASFALSPTSPHVPHTTSHWRGIGVSHRLQESRLPYPASSMLSIEYSRELSPEDITTLPFRMMKESTISGFILHTSRTNDLARVGAMVPLQFRPMR